MINELKQLHASISKAKALLDDPQEGAFMWNRLLRDRLLEIQESLCALGVTHEHINKERDRD